MCHIKGESVHTGPQFLHSLRMWLEGWVAVGKMAWQAPWLEEWSHILLLLGREANRHSHITSSWLPSAAMECFNTRYAAMWMSTANKETETSCIIRSKITYTHRSYTQDICEQNNSFPPIALAVLVWHERAHKALLIGTNKDFQKHVKELLSRRREYQWYCGAECAANPLPPTILVVYISANTLG